MRRTTTIARPIAALAACAAFATLTACGSRSTGQDESSSAARERRAAEREAETSASTGSDPFADLEVAERRAPSRRVAVPVSKAEQMKLVDDPAWREAVEKAHAAEIIFRDAGRSWDTGKLTAEEREEIKRGKAMLGDAADATWQLEQDLMADPSQRSLYDAVSKVRTRWIDRMREVGKLVRG